MSHGHDHLFFPEDLITKGKWWRLANWTTAAAPSIARLAAALALIATVAFLVVIAPEMLFSSPKGLSPADQVKAQNDIRTALLQATAGLALVAGLYFTAKTVSVNQRGQVTDRFTKTVEQIGSENVDVRIGGLYSLARIAKDSPEYRAEVTEIVVHYIQGRARDVSREQLDIGVDPVPRDVQVAAGILGRRQGRGLETKTLNLWGRNLNKTDFTKAHLADANLCYAYVDNSYFEQADLSEATFVAAKMRSASACSANFRGAFFTGADVSGTYFCGTDFTNAFFGGADLTGADFSGRKAGARWDIRPAKMRGANLRGAKLEGTNFSGVDLRRTIGLTQAQLDDATIDAETRLPVGLSPRKASGEP
ncbi:pentapeptide repeat-containing protein [Micromonospora sp. NPDC049101]|uniref:pentapeptide repeat-containing protein n=1 Tax=Micromonospora sp. NPDC049101 TaxID=3155032 RepID=UPI0033EB8F56